MVMSLAAAAAWLRAGPVIVSYADIFYRGELVRGLAHAPGALVISYDRLMAATCGRGASPIRWRMPRPSASMRPGELLEIGGKTARIEDIEGSTWGCSSSRRPHGAPSKHCSTGSMQPTRDRLDMTGLLRRLLAGKTIPIATFGTDGQWGEIDNPGDVELYQNMVRGGELVLEEALTRIKS
jgi:choline kinase